MRANPQRLWAPWRKKFLTLPKNHGCFLCAARRSRNDRACHVILRGKHVFALLNLYPYNNGHLMIAPYRHVGDFNRLTAAEWQETLAVSQKLLKRLKRLLNPHGFNIGFNLGRAAGAGVPGHLHLHLVPRWVGDTNFMTLIGHSKVISQSLDELYLLLTRKKR